MRTGHLVAGGRAEARGVGPDRVAAGQPLGCGTPVPGRHEGPRKRAQRDVRPIAGQAGGLSRAAGAPRDATGGGVACERAASLGIVAAVAMLVLPPARIASGHGMTFGPMPETGGHLGGPMAPGVVAAGLMAASAVAARVIVRRKECI
ncbi:hypothetical protein DRV84_07730 [Rhodosalinus sediminis]|uniref:Uncharacterized protein n=2 Tax=Rhodosalinus sediminis TaxID=1940533 RepID=A0A3D9BUW6_9RHOB|nr:hypothetical protein DRV84_07730 [Rhodosalinus sediminis]